MDVAAAEPVATGAQNAGKNLAWAISFWFVLQVFFNDIGQLLRINVGINLRPDRLLFAALILMFAIYRRRHGVRISVHPAEWCMLLLLLWGMVSLVIAGTIYHPYNRHLATLTNLIGIPLVTFWLVRRSSLSERDVVIVFRTLIVLGIYLVVTALGEHYKISALVFPTYILDPNVGIHLGRARGPFGNAAVMGGVLSTIYLTTLFYIKNIRAALTLHALLALIAVSIYFTYTRSAWLTFLMSFVFLSLASGRMRRHSASVLLAVLLVFLSGAFSKFSFENGTLFSKRQTPIEDRENIMRASIAMIKERPIFGFGYGTFEANNDNYFDREGRRSNGQGNHNAFSGLLVELGLVGGIPYILTWWFILRPSWRLAWHRDKANVFWRQIGALAIAVVTGYLVGVQFFDPRFFGFLNCLVFFISGLACAADDRYRSQAAVTHRVRRAPIACSS